MSTTSVSASFFTSAAGGEVGGDVAVAAVAALSCQGGGTQNNIVLYT